MAPATRSGSTAAKSGSGRITIPAPPPYGASSTTRCRPMPCSRRSWTRDRQDAALDRPADHRGAQRRVEELREEGDDVDPQQRREGSSAIAQTSSAS